MVRILKVSIKPMEAKYPMSVALHYEVMESKCYFGRFYPYGYGCLYYTFCLTCPFRSCFYDDGNEDRVRGKNRKHNKV